MRTPIVTEEGVVAFFKKRCVVTREQLDWFLREKPHNHILQKRSYFRNPYNWWNVHYILGIVGTISAITVVSQPEFLLLIPYFVDCFAWISAICIVGIAFLMPSRRARAYVSAWRILNDACNRYKMDENYSIEQLIDAVQEGEKIIASSDPL